MSNLYRTRLWRSGDDLLLTIADVGEIELSRDDALALSAEIANLYPAPIEPPKRRPYRYMTADEPAEICRLYQEGVGPVEIGRRLNRSVNPIYKVLRKAGVPARNQKISENMKKVRARRKAAA